MRLDILGIKEQDCPLDPCDKIACYVPCEHRGIVYSKVPVRPYTAQKFLSNLLDSILQVQEEFIQMLCADDDICEQGYQLGFPCVQCGFSTYSLGENKLDPCVPGCVFIEVLPEYAMSQFIDLSNDEYIVIYGLLVEWLKCYRGCAGGRAMSDFANAIGGNFIGYDNGIYSISIPNDEKLINILTILESIAPVPFGACVKFYIINCES